MLRNEATGTEIVVRPPLAVIGRSESCEVAIADESVSREHAAVYLRRGAWRVRDLGSSKGTEVKRHGDFDPVSGEERLHSGDEITLGDATLRVVSAEVSDGSDHIFEEAIEHAGSGPVRLLVVRKRVSLSTVTAFEEASWPTEEETFEELREVAPVLAWARSGGESGTGHSSRQLVVDERHLGALADWIDAHHDRLFRAIDASRWGDGRVAWEPAIGRAIAAVPVEADEAVSDLRRRVDRQLEWTERTIQRSLGRVSCAWYGDDLLGWAGRAETATSWAFCSDSSPRGEALTSSLPSQIDARGGDHRWWMAGDDESYAIATTLPEAELGELLGRVEGVEWVTRPAGSDAAGWVESMRMRANRRASVAGFPTPLARLRAELASRHFQSPETEIPALLESTVRFASLALAAALGDDAIRAGRGVALPAEWRWERPSGVGANLALAKEAASRLQGVVPPELFALSQREPIRAIYAAVARRNDIAHERASSVELDRDVDEISRALTDLVERLGSIGERLVDVRESQPLRGRRSERARISARPLVGIYPPPATTQLVDEMIVPGLWLRGLDGRWISLSPLLRWAPCERCGRWDLFCAKTVTRHADVVELASTGMLHGRHPSTERLALTDYPELEAMLE